MLAEEGAPSSGQVSLVHLGPPCMSASEGAFLSLEISTGDGGRL